MRQGKAVGGAVYSLLGRVKPVAGVTPTLMSRRERAQPRDRRRGNPRGRRLGALSESALI